MFDKLMSKLIKGDKKSKSTSPQAWSINTYNPYSVSSVMACLENGSYDNNYPNITKIAEQFAITFPYAIDAQGEQLKEVPQLVKALYNPNKQMSATRFFKTIAVLSLVFPAVHILVHKRTTGKLTPDNIAGFTFLEDYRIDVRDGKRYFIRGDKTYTDDEVVTISLDVNPYSVLAGYSPSVASKKYSSLDDCIADFQIAYFQNGAKPAGQMIITAPTREAFEESVDYLQAHHRGSKRNNNIIYTHRPVNDRGEAQNAQIEWIPFNEGGNKSLSLKELFEQAEKVRDTNFGVPAEVKGLLKNSNYASVSTAMHIFEKYTVYPKLLQVWTDFTHEMNRITGGLGYSLTFDYEIQPLEDENKMKAETQKIQMETIMSATEKGFSLESVVEALGLPEDFKKLEQQIVNAQDPELEVPETTDVDQVETSLGKSVKNKNINDVVENIDPKLVEAIDESMLEQIESAIKGENFDENEKRNTKLSKNMFEALIVMMLLTGGAQYVSGRIMLTRSGIDALMDGAYDVSKGLREKYQKYLVKVAKSYNTGTADSIRRVIERGAFEKWNNEQLADNLRNIMNTDEWRVQRLARSETHRANGLSSLDAMEQVQDENDVALEKVWTLNPYSTNHCGDCEALDGVILPLDEPFISAEDNEFADIESADAHPNCGCYLTYRIARNQKSVDIECPNCHRHMAKSTGGEICDMKCQGCKKHFDFKVVAGRITANETTKAKE